MLAEDPGEDLFVALGKAVMALPPYVDKPPDADYPRTRALLARLGQMYDPRFTAVAQLEHALAALESAGLAMSDQRIDVYGENIREIATSTSTYSRRPPGRRPSKPPSSAPRCTNPSSPRCVASRTSTAPPVSSRMQPTPTIRTPPNPIDTRRRPSDHRPSVP